MAPQAELYTLMCNAVSEDDAGACAHLLQQQGTLQVSALVELFALAAESGRDACSCPCKHLAQPAA